ncbi:MAG TPA: type II secretion system F family protein [Bacillales bacterium]|nr:type II secretion system F family protein [Bacillales bacterium]
MLYVAFFCTVVLFISFWISLRRERQNRVQKRISSVFHQQSSVLADEEQEERRSLWERIGAPLWHELKQNFQRGMKSEETAKLEMKLLQAGSPMGMAPVEFLILKIVMLILFPVLAMVYGSMLNAGKLVILLLAAFALIVAWGLPNYYLRLKTKQRNHKALRELPDILDLLTVSLEAGLGFDSALGKVVSRKNGVLSGEFRRCLEEIRLGKTRRDALSGVRDRLILNELRVLISNILQAEKLGIGLVKVLRIQSEEVREQRKQRAEETAMKAPIKMLFPLVLFIFPSLFIVLLGPAVLQFIDTFSNN